MSVTVEREICCIVENWSRGYKGSYYQPPEPPEPEDYHFIWLDTGTELTEEEYKHFEKECEEALSEAEPDGADPDAERDRLMEREDRYQGGGR